MWKLSLAHWPEYLCEAGLVAFFVLADCLITIAVKLRLIMFVSPFKPCRETAISMLALHLIQNCMVYINTLMIQKVLAQPHWHGRLTPRDYAAHPLIWEHVNPYGRFDLDITASKSWIPWERSLRFKCSATTN